MVSSSSMKLDNTDFFNVIKNAPSDLVNAILISKKGSSQKVKNVVALIKKQAPTLAEIHNLAHRPWGAYEVLLDTSQYKIKRIRV